MSISKEIEGKIVRHYHVDGWLVGTIAKQLGIHHSTVERVLRENGVSSGLKPRIFSEAQTSYFLEQHY